MAALKARESALMPGEEAVVTAILEKWYKFAFPFRSHARPHTRAQARGPKVMPMVLTERSGAKSTAGDS